MRRIVGAVAVVALAAAALALVVLSIDIVLATFGGLLVAVLLHALTGLLVRYARVPERAGYPVLLVLLAGLLAAAFVLLAPTVEEQTQRAREEVPRIAADVEGYLEQRFWGRWILDQVRDGGEETAPQDVLAALGALLGGLTNWFYYLLTMLFVGLFAAARPALYVHGTADLFPPAWRPRVRHALEELGFVLRWWLVGQLLSMVVIGVSTWLVLWTLDVPLAAALGLLVGLLGFVPYLGPILGLIPVALIAGTQGVETLFYVSAAYIAVQIVEGYVITPLIQHRMVYLPPMFTVIMQILFGSVLGALGFMFATPLAAVLLVLSRFYREDMLGEKGVVMRSREPAR